MKKILIYGGSFNPLHNGHDAIIRRCTTMKEYDGLWIMPSARRQDKPALQSDIARLAMLRKYWVSLPLCIAERVHVSDFEIQLGAPSQTIRTHIALQKAYPDSTFIYIFGADTIRDMVNWNGGTRLRSELAMVIVARYGYDIPQGYAGMYIDINDSQQVSSTIVRQRIRNEQPFDHLVPPSIRRYIQLNELYT